MIKFCRFLDKAAMVGEEEEESRVAGWRGEEPVGAMHGDAGGGAKKHVEDVAGVGVHHRPLHLLSPALHLLHRPGRACEPHPLLLLLLYHPHRLRLRLRRPEPPPPRSPLRIRRRAPRGLTTLQHIGAALFVSVLALAVSAAATRPPHALSSGYGPSSSSPAPPRCSPTSASSNSSTTRPPSGRAASAAPCS